MNPEISIVTVNWWGDDFARLLQSSAVNNAKGEFELIIVDNSNSYKASASYLKVIRPMKNFGHGRGLNMGIKQASGEYILVMDIDSHILMKNWDEKLIAAYNDPSQAKAPDMARNDKLRLIGAEGGLLKPMRPAVMFFKKDFFIENEMTFEACAFNGVKFDVGIHFYFKTLSLGCSVDFLKWKKTEFIDTMGEEYTLNGERAFFHHWWATRWYDMDGKRRYDQIDGIKWDDFKIKRDNFFRQAGK